jgi:hypothetical protein
MSQPGWALQAESNLPLLRARECFDGGGQCRPVANENHLFNGAR